MVGLLDDLRSPSRILFLEQVISPHHLETSLDSALQLATQGHSVRYLHLGRLLPHIEFKRNPLVSCNLVRDLGAALASFYSRPALLGVELANEYAKRKLLDAEFLLLESGRGWESSAPPRPARLLTSSLASLKTFFYNGKPVGSALASSLVSSCRSSQVFPWLHPFKLTALWRAYWLGWRAFEAFGKDWADCLVVFNGRFAFPKGAAHIASDNGVQVRFHERGGADQRGFFLEDFQTHDNYKRADYYMDLWHRSLKRGADPQALAESFLLKKSRSELNSRENFTERQVRGKREANLSPGTVVYFTGSDDETVSLGDLAPWSCFSNQREAIQKLIATCVNQRRQLVIRVHPNVRTKSLRERLWWGKFNPLLWRKNVRLLTAGNKVSSYELLDRAEVVVVWRSSIAYEAVYRRKPVLALSEASYLLAGLSASMVKSEQELIDILKFRKWTGPRPETAIKFAHGVAVSKHSFRHYEPFGIHGGAFLGTNLFSSPRR